MKTPTKSHLPSKASTCHEMASYIGTAMVIYRRFPTRRRDNKGSTETINKSSRMQISQCGPHVSFQLLRFARQVSGIVSTISLLDIRQIPIVLFPLHNVTWVADTFEGVHHRGIDSSFSIPQPIFIHDPYSR